ncbi:META domain-containing protein [Marinobacter sp. X15-166B]|uniref:META domain-containing protein n=1 Tax=Marinobacter sp. X15-166B TaxID=1897620 RepID=UPI00085CA039|nr:META domain-containing protein [Marinobacter sp. X15-166B]OEY65728.1 hypothetical protein BG841_04170 [Marinobacter sp. X15-166B]
MKGLLPFGMAALGAVALLSGCAAPGPTVDATEGSRAILMECGQLNVALAFEGDELLLDAAGERYRMARVSAAAGSKYQLADDPATSLWRTGNRATLTLGGNSLPECRVVGALVEPFVAGGNEPFWQLRAEDGGLRLTRPGYETLTLAPYKIVATSASGSTVVAETEAGRLQLEVARQVCKDTMTGMNFPFQVRLTLDDTGMAGCGGDPVRLLQGVEWVVEAIGGAGIIDSSRVTLNFLPEGRVAGRATCNQFMGTYAVGGEGLVIEQPATTLMACAPALMHQERRFLELLTRVSGFDIDPQGALQLYTDDGTALRAVMH